MYFLTVAVVGKLPKFYFRQFLNAIRQILSVFLMLFNEYLSCHSAIIGLCVYLCNLFKTRLLFNPSALINFQNLLKVAPEIVKLHF